MVPDWYNPQSLNRYTYCLNNPLIYVDPMGHNNVAIDMGAMLEFAELNGTGQFEISQAMGDFSGFDTEFSTEIAQFVTGFMASYGPELKAGVGSSGTAFFLSNSWNSPNPSKSNLSYDLFTLFGGGWQFFLTTNPDSTPTINLGLSNALGLSFGPGYISLNLGYAISPPVTITVPK